MLPSEHRQELLLGLVSLMLKIFALDIRAQDQHLGWTKNDELGVGQTYLTLNKSNQIMLSPKSFLVETLLSLDFTVTL